MLSICSTLLGAVNAVFEDYNINYKLSKLVSLVYEVKGWKGNNLVDIRPASLLLGEGELRALFCLN